MNGTAANLVGSDERPAFFRVRGFFMLTIDSRAKAGKGKARMVRVETRVRYER